MPVLRFPNRARVLTPAYVARLAEANRAARRLRELGCKVLRTHVDADGAVIQVDRNPHRVLADCPGVHILVGRARTDLAECLPRTW